MTTSTTSTKPRAAKRRRQKKESTTQSYPVVIDKESFKDDLTALELVMLSFLYLEYLTKLLLKRVGAIT